jgi:hypothetical protein
VWQIFAGNILALSVVVLAGNTLALSVVVFGGEYFSIKCGS